MNTMKKRTRDAAKYLCLFIFLFTIINAAQSDTFSEWDQNNNDKLSKTEFRENFSAEHYSAWDTNSDEQLTQEEYYKAIFMVLDENNDHQLSTSETDWGFEHLYGDYVDYDVDVKEGKNSSTLTYKQFREAVRDTRFYSETDTDSDSNLTREELSNSIFENLDWDNDGTVTHTEFDQFSRFYIGGNSDS